MKNLAYYDGRWGEMETMQIPMSDRVCFFGDAVYDATYSRNYKIFALSDHVDRFLRSAALLEIEPPMSKDALMSLLEEMVQKMDTGENFVYFQLSRSGAPIRDHTFPEGTGAGKLWINIYPKKIADLSVRAKLITAEDTRFLHCNIKTVNLIPAVMASQRAKRLGCHETVFHRGGRVTECAHSNVHILKDGCFITAPTDNLILPGIARKHLIAACHRHGIPVREEPYDLDALMSADEVMISSAGVLCRAADEVDGIPVGGRAPELLSVLQDAVLREFMEETDVKS